MSHPVPTRDYGVDEHDPHDFARNRKLNKKQGPLHRVGKVLTAKAKALDAMIKEPASKEWFKKHGTPKFLKDGKGLEVKK